MAIDLTNPQVTVVEKSLKGKTMLWYGTNGTGKTDNATKMSRPFAIAFEDGLNAIAGLPYHQPKKWIEAKEIKKQLKRPEVKELYDTIIIDTLEKGGRLLIKYVCSLHGVENIGDANNGFGAYQEVEKEWDDFLTDIANEGYTVVIIAHDKIDMPTDPETGKKYERSVPKGDKRVVAATCDLVDIVGYCESNGYDENGEERLSSMYFKDGKFFKARSRWRNIVKSIEVFNIQNLTNAIEDAIEAQEKEDGKKNYVDKKETVETESLTFEESAKQIKELANIIKEKTGKWDIFTETVENKLGEGKKVSDCTEKHQEVIEEILKELKEKVSNL